MKKVLMIAMILLLSAPQLASADDNEHHKDRMEFQKELANGLI